MKEEMHHRAPSRARLGLATALLALAATLGVGCLEDDVTYGPVGGLRIRGEVAPDPCALPAGLDGPPAVCPDWATDVFPLLDGTYGCTLDGCHAGPNDPTGVNMVPGDADASYDALAAFVRGDRPYIAPNGQEEAYLLCNIDQNAPVRIGTLMPTTSPKIAGDDLITIAGWVACGMLKTGGTPGVGGGGTGGATGTGGAGGT